MRAADLRELATRFASSLSYELRVPGVHPSGLTYERLIAILAGQGRDFRVESERLWQHVVRVIVEQFADARRPPGLAQLRQFAAAAIHEWLVARIEARVRDVPIRRLSPAYLARKRAEGSYRVPLMRTGALRDQVRDRGRVILRTQNRGE